MKKILLCVASIFAILSVVFITTDFAIAGTGLSIQPIKASHTLEPGESVSGTISLTNASEDKINVDVTVEDFIPSAGTTNVQFVGRAEGNTTVRDWVSLDIPEQFIFEEGASRNIKYTVTAPPDAEPGGHFGVAFFKATKIDDQGQLKVGTRIGMLMFITIPGNQLQKGNVLDFFSPKFVQKGPVPFEIKFENTGTVHFEPKGQITITNIFGKVVGVVEVAGQAVLPTGARNLSAAWAGSLLFGRYTANLNIVDGEGNELTASSVAFYAFPLWYILWSLLAIILLFYTLKFIRNKISINISVNK